MEIKLEKTGKFVYNVKFNQTKIGTFELDVDGFYYFWSIGNSAGCWASHTLKTVAEKLEEVNKPYKEVVDEYFDKERRDFEERARVGYRKLLNESGMFFEFYPALTGEWVKDKEQWFVEYEGLEASWERNDRF